MQSYNPVRLARATSSSSRKPYGLHLTSEHLSRCVYCLLYLGEAHLCGWMCMRDHSNPRRSYADYARIIRVFMSKRIPTIHRYLLNAAYLSAMLVSGNLGRPRNGGVGHDKAIHAQLDCNCRHISLVGLRQIRRNLHQERRRACASRHGAFMFGTDCPPNASSSCTLQAALGHCASCSATDQQITSTDHLIGWLAKARGIATQGWCNRQ